MLDKVATVPMIETRCYALRNITTGNMVFYRCSVKRCKAIPRFMARAEAEHFAKTTIGSNAMDFVEVVRLNKAGGIIE